jgi:hypothetical protein
MWGHGQQRTDLIPSMHRSVGRFNSGRPLVASVDVSDL